MLSDTSPLFFNLHEYLLVKKATNIFSDENEGSAFNLSCGCDKSYINVLIKYSH